MDRRNRFSTQNNQKSVTNQKWKKTSDIKHIVKKNRIARLNQINPNLVETRTEAIAVFDTAESYHDKMNQCVNAQNVFKQLPAELQKKFAFDVANMIDFMQDPQNKQECEKLGLLPRDMKDVKYEDKEGKDITEEIYKKRGFFVDGVRVDKKGQPLVYAQNGDLIEKDGTVVQTKAELDAAKQPEK